MGEKKFSLEELAQIVGGILTKVEDVVIDKVAPPKLADENTLALAMNEEEIQNMSESKAKAVLNAIWIQAGGSAGQIWRFPRHISPLRVSLFHAKISLSINKR